MEHSIGYSTRHHTEHLRSCTARRHLLRRMLMESFSFLGHDWANRTRLLWILKLARGCGPGWRMRRRDTDYSSLLLISCRYSITNILPICHTSVPRPHEQGSVDVHRGAGCDNLNELGLSRRCSIDFLLTYRMPTHDKRSKGVVVIVSDESIRERRTESRLERGRSRFARHERQHQTESGLVGLATARA